MEEHSLISPTLVLEQHLDHQLGTALATKRRERGMTLSELAFRTGLPIAELSEHEDGTLPISLVRAAMIEFAMGIPHATLANFATRLACPGS